MSNPISLVPANLHEALDVAANLCPEDVAELAALGMQPAATVVDCIRASELAFFLKIKGRVASVFGVVRAEGGGRFWLLTTPEVRRYPKLFIRAARAIVPSLLGEFGGHLWNEMGIDQRHTTALRLARFMGFELGTPVPRGPFALPFVPFSLRKAA